MKKIHKCVCVNDQKYRNFYFIIRKCWTPILNRMNVPVISQLIGIYNSDITALPLQLAYEITVAI